MRLDRTQKAHDEMLVCNELGWEQVEKVSVRLVYLFSLSCVSPSALLASGVRVENGCPLGQFPCGNMSDCLPQALQCNGNKDCPNGADEQHCGKSVSHM